jgi:hypothetical protein
MSAAALQNPRRAGVWPPGESRAGLHHKAGLNPLSMYRRPILLVFASALPLVSFG